MIYKNNKKRVITGMAICLTTGKTVTSFRINEKKKRDFKIVKIGLTRDRAELYDRINKRVDMMVEGGLIDEAKSVYKFKHLNSLNTVGYKELFDFFDGNCTEEFAIEKIKQHSRIYSRKQMTWFKRDEDIKWFHPDQISEAIDYIRLITLHQ